MRHTSDMDPLQLWTIKSCGSRVTEYGYTRRIMRFFETVGTTPEEIVAEWKQVKYDYRQREQFLDEWIDKIETYVYSLEDFAPTSRMQELTTIVSFFKHNRIPVEPEREKHIYVKYHNRDITREEIRRVLENASSLRDRLFFLMMAESGLRPYTLVQLRYKHIKKDFENNRVPMMIELPSELLKDRVEARWTFIGKDALKIMREYLKARIPLKNEDLIFAPERRDAKYDFLTPETFSKKFSKVALKLGITERQENRKPKEIRLYCLRKYFMNNVRCDTAFREFWMGHKTTQTHYISRDPERHRKEYKKAYENLRIYKAETEQSERIAKLERELEELRAFARFMEKPSPYIYIPDNLHGEERLNALEELVKEVMVMIKEIKISGTDEWERLQKACEKARKKQGTNVINPEVFREVDKHRKKKQQKKQQKT